MPTLGAGTPPSRPQAQLKPKLLHGLLAGGLVGMAIAAGAWGLWARFVDGQAPFGGVLGEDSVASPAVSALVIASALMLASALVVLKPRVPRRRAGQTLDTFWADVNTSKSAMLFWFILEGSGVIGLVAYLLGGSLIPAALALVAITAFWMNGPVRFEQE